MSIAKIASLVLVLGLLCSSLIAKSLIKNKLEKSKQCPTACVYIINGKCFARVNVLSYLKSEIKLLVRGDFALYNGQVVPYSQLAARSDSEQNLGVEIRTR